MSIPASVALEKIAAALAGIRRALDKFPSERIFRLHASIVKGDEMLTELRRCSQSETPVIKFLVELSASLRIKYNDVIADTNTLFERNAHAIQILIDLSNTIDTQKSDTVALDSFDIALARAQACLKGFDRLTRKT